MGKLGLLFAQCICEEIFSFHNYCTTFEWLLLHMIFQKVGIRKQWFLVLFQEYMHVGCTMQNEECQLYFLFVVSMFKVGNRMRYIKI